MEIEKNIGEAKAVEQPNAPFRFKLKDGCVKSNHLAAESVATSNIQNGAVSTEKIMNEAVTNAKIMDGAITNSKINNGAITNEKIANNSIDNSKIQDLTLTGDKFINNSIDGNKIVDNSIPGSKLADGAIESVDLEDGTLDGKKLVDNSVLGDKLVNGAVTSEKLKDNSIDGSKIADGTVQGLDIKDGTISGSKLVDNSISGTKLSNGIITNSKIADNSITGDKFLDESISGEKIIPNTIHGNKLENNTVDGADIIAGTLDGSKIKNMSIDGDNIQDDSIETRHIKSNTITGTKIQNNAIGSEKIRTNSLIGDNFADGAITSAKIVDNAITNVKIVNNTITGDKFADNTITGDKIQDNTVSGSKLKDGTIESVDIKDGTLSGAKLVNNSVDGAKLADNSITSAHLIDNSIPGSKIKDGTIENVDIKDGTLDGSKLKDGSILTAKIYDGAVTTAKIAAEAITTDKIDNLAVTEDKLATGAVTNGKIANGAVTENKLSTGSVTSDKITNGSVTEAKLGTGAVTNTKLVDGSVTENKIGTGAVTEGKINSAAVTTAKIANDAVTTDKIADGNVTSAKILDAAITTAKVNDGAVTTAKIPDSNITTDKIANGAVATAKIADGAVTTTKIPDNNVTTAKIDDGAITTAKISNESITTDKIADGTVATAKIADEAVTEDKLADGAITPEKIADSTITELQTIMDEVPTVGSVKPITSRGVLAHGSAFDISEYNKNEGTLATYATLADALAAIPSSVYKGGMSIKYVHTSDNNYVKFFCTADEFSTDVEDWEHAASVEDLKNGNVVPAMAETLKPWADQKAIATPDTYTDAVRTTGGDIPIETSAGSKLESIKPVAGSKWTAKLLFNGSYNMLNAAKWGAANSQPYVGGVGGDFVYFLVPELTLGTFGTADENNGLLFTDAEGENVQPTSVYFKPLGATVPQSLTDGTSITPTNVSYDGKTYKDYATDGAGWLIIPKSYYDNDVCAHIAWEDWYDKYVSLDEPTTNPEAVVGILMLEGLLALAHSDKYLRGVNEEVCDNVVFGKTSATITHMVDELSVAANAWTNSATGESDSHGNALYRHSATVSLIKQGGAACIEGKDGGIPLTVNGTTVSYVDTNATAPASVVFYEVTATSTTKAYTDSIFNGSNINTETGILPINDCSIEAQVAMDGKANITVKYAKNIVDQVAINATVDVPQIKREVENHEERITNLEDTAVRTGSYDASVAVGLANNFKGDTIVDAEFYKRKTGGTQSVGSGIAAIKEMRGKSIVWNQLIPISENDNSKTESGVTFTDNRDGSVTCNGTATEDIHYNFPNFKLSDGTNIKLLFVGISGGSNSTYYIAGAGPNWGSTIIYDDRIFTKPSDAKGGSFSLYVKSGCSVTGLRVRPVFINLTLMFGAGNEPATVEEFEKMFPLDYYDYNEGEVIPFAGENIVTAGKNQYNPATGKANLFGGKQYQIRGTYTKIYPTVSLVDYTYGSPVVSGTYYTNANSHYVGAKEVSTYDNTKTYALGAYCVYDNAVYKANVAIETAEEFDATHWDIIADVAAMVTDGILILWDIVPDVNGVFTLTKDTEVTIVGGNDTDTIIALYNGENVTFEPYEKHTLPLDPSQWRDKQGNLVFPYGGMHGVGTAYDYAKVDADGYIRKAVRVLEEVDLGDLTWTYNTDSPYPKMRANLNPYPKNQSVNIINVLGLPAIIPTEMYNNGKYGILLNSGRINIRTATMGSSASDFKAAMSGKMLVYPLATPVEVELATPIYAKYLVDKDGTEEITPANGSTPYTTMANLSILYAMDARGEIKNLPKNYLSKESAENMLNAMVSAGVIASYTMTWDVANNRYAFVIQKNSEQSDTDN